MMLERIVISLALIAVLLVAYRLFEAGHKARASSAKLSTRGDFARQPSLLYFRSDHCTPCVTQAQFLQQLPEQMTRQIKIEQIDAEKERDLAAKYGVFTLPTTMLVDRQGSVKHVNYGLIDAHRLTSQLESVL
jgi:thioredoxin-like negative regulator of GroEL